MQNHEEKAKRNLEIKPGSETYYGYLGGLLDSASGCINVNIKASEKEGIVFTPTVEYSLPNRKGEKEILEMIKSHLESVHVDSRISDYLGGKREENKIELTINGWYNVRQLLKWIHPYSIAKYPQIEIMLTKILPMLEPKDKSTTPEKTRYSEPEIKEIRKWIDELNLLDI